jgi:glycosyltransferase involved in cell wall biosynthesis
MAPSRVVIFASSFKMGGSERQALELFRNMDRTVFDPRLASFSTEGPLATLLPCPMDEVQVYPLAGFHRKSCLDQARRFYRYLTSERIEVVQCFDFYSNLFAIPVARLAGVPIILGARREESTMKTSLQRGIQRFCYRIGTGVVANAGSLREALIKDEHLSPDRVWAIPNGLDLQAFDAQTSQSRYPKADKGLRIAVVANLRPEKGHRVFLEAVSSLAPQHPHVKFLIAGDGPMRETIEAHIEQHNLKDRVHLLGAIRDIPAFLASLDGLVLPSITNEGFPNAVMEAMAASLPVVATDTGGTRDLVVDGETGYVVPPQDARQLAARLDVLCRDAKLRRKMGEAGRWRVIRHFTTQHMSRQYEELYASLLSV